MRAPRLPANPLAVLLLSALLVGGCTGASSPGASNAAASGGACATAPAPAAELPGWPTTVGSPGSALIPSIVSSELACGPNRLVISLLDAASGLPAATPDRSVTLAFYNLGRDPGRAVATAPGRFVWGIEGERGVYVVPVDFPEAGEWGAELTIGGSGAQPTPLRLRFEVKPVTTSVAVGATAPSVRTPTLADAGGDVGRISTDASPNPAFYETSVDAALAAHRPFVLAFATPKLCASRQCGPTLDVVKAAAKAEPGMLFINVEPYELEWSAGTLAPVVKDGGLVPTAATNAYRIISEPWVYVVDREGIVRASLEGIFSVDELTAAIEAVK